MYENQIIRQKKRGFICESFNIDENDILHKKESELRRDQNKIKIKIKRSIKNKSITQG